MTIEYKDSKRIVTSGDEYKVHSFTSTGNTNFVVTGSGDVEYLVVAGGGGGGGAKTNYGGAGGGGGAGGFRTATGFGVTAQTYTITVGAGGSGGVADNAGNNGNNSIFSTITSTGGGYGGSGSGALAGDGGSGGGGSGTGTTDFGSGNTPSTNPSQGFNGALGGTGGYSASGGGGSSAVGIRTAVIGGHADGGAGGAGTANSIQTGTAITYAGGGGGGGYLTNGGGAGGSGGGGNGGIASSSTAPVAGSANLGGGGGGALSKQPASNGAAGGSGIVIIRYLTSSGITATGGTITTVTEEEAKPTNVQDNSILVEKDTARRYWFSEATSDYTQYGWAVDSSTRIQTLGASASLPSSGTFTWSFWYRPNSISADHYLFNKLGSSSGEYSPRLYLQTTGALKATSTTNGVGYGGNAITSNVMTIGSWNHVICKQTGNIIYAILNNGTASSASVISGNNSGEDYQFFLDNTGVDGDIKNAILYSTALSASDITALYNSGTPATSSTAGVTSNILIEHIFDSDISTTSAANTGSLGGSASVIVGTASVVGTPATWTGNIDLTGLKSYYNFEQTSTTLTNMATSVGSTDSLGSSGDATGSGTITKGATGIIGNAWDFGGGKVTTSHQLIPTSGYWTYSTWVNLDTLSGGEEILRHESPAFEVWRNSGGLNVSGASGTINIEPAGNLATGTWYNIVLVHSSSGDVIYLNGVSKSTSDIVSVPTGTSWYLGGRASTSEALNGQMDETTVWSRALSSSEVSGLYNSGRGKIVY